jgi:hypothetical protein
MSDSFHKLVLKSDFDQLPTAEDRDPADRWSAVLVDNLEVHVELSPVATPDESFQARLCWDVYPDAPPSLLFRDPATGRTDVPHAWPTGGPFRPTSGLCVNYTREGFALHPEWAKDARLKWRGNNGSALLKVIRLLQDDLDNFFSGRAG